VAHDSWPPKVSARCEPLADGPLAAQLPHPDPVSAPTIDQATLTPVTSSGTDPARIAANQAAVRAAIGQWIVHDLRGPVQGVALIGDLLIESESPIEPSVRELLRDNVRRMRELLNVLAWLFEPTGTRPAQPVALLGVLDMITTIHRSHRGRVTFDVDHAAFARLPAVRGTPHDLTHALLNLVLNALEAQVGQQGGAIRVRGAVIADGVSAEVIVEDDGPGLPADVRRAFAEPSGESVPSSGLGLSVARSLIRQYGGSLVAASPTPSGGARVVLTLPVWHPTSVAAV
jgi:signal transduction histidine kinase